jgi:hypothetical protein
VEECQEEENDGKSKVEDTLVVRRSRKNAQSRYRANKLKLTISEIKAKDPSERTPEEVKKLALYEERRLRKNGRSRERALERKKRFAIVSAKPEEEWTEEEKTFMRDTLVAKFKKNEGDRLRRKRMRERGETLSCSTNADGSGGGVERSTKLKPKKTSLTDTFVHFHNEEPQEITSDTMNAVHTAVSHSYDDSVVEDDFEPEFFDMNMTNERDPMSHFIFPSNERTYMHSPTLELCAETSILDQSLEEIAYSPRHMNIHTPNPVNTAEVEIEGANYEAFSQPHLNSPINLMPLNLPRRTKSGGNNEAYVGDMATGDMDDMERQEPIAVSFSMDTL